MPRQDPNEGIGQAQANDLERNAQYGNYIQRPTTLGLGASTVPQTRAQVRYMPPNMQFQRGSLIQGVYDPASTPNDPENKKKPDVIWGNPNTKDATALGAAAGAVPPAPGAAAGAVPPAPGAAAGAVPPAPQPGPVDRNGRSPDSPLYIPPARQAQQQATVDRARRRIAPPPSGDMELDDIDTSPSVPDSSAAASAGSVAGGGPALATPPPVGTAAATTNPFRAPGAPSGLADGSRSISAGTPASTPQLFRTSGLPSGNAGSALPLGSTVTLGSAAGTVAAPAAPATPAAPIPGPARYTRAGFEVIPGDDGYDTALDVNPYPAPALGTAASTRPGVFSRIGSAFSGFFGGRPSSQQLIPSEADLESGRTYRDALL